MVEEKKYFGFSKEELIENALISLVMAGVSFVVAFLGAGVKTYIQRKIQPK